MDQTKTTEESNTSCGMREYKLLLFVSEMFIGSMTYSGDDRRKINTAIQNFIPI